MSISVTLTPLELDLAMHVACQRNRDGIQANADNAKHGNDAGSLELHLRGALGELALAKATNRYWSGAGVGYHDEEDVGHVQVRVTQHLDGCLIVRPGDGHADQPWVLVTGSYPDYTVVGWIIGRDARQGRFLRDPNGRPPAYFVPQSELVPLEAR